MAACVFGSHAAGQTAKPEYAIIVNQKSGVQSLTTSKLQQIFKREQKFWPGSKKSKINLVLPKSSTPEMKVAREKLYNMTEKELKKYWVQMIYQNKISHRPKRFPSNKVLVRLVAKDASAVSIVSAADAKKGAGVRVLKVDGKAPGDKGYSLVESKAKALGLIGDDDVANVDSSVLAADLTEASGPRGTDAVEAAVGLGQNPEGERRMDQLEDELLDLQIAMLGGESEGDAFEGGPLLALKGFGHVTYGVDTSDISADEGNQFALGGLDLFITSQLSENLSFLNETVFEPTPDGEYILDVERVILKYTVSDALNVSGGRFHTSLGFWNTEYHHGEWLQTTVGRPGVLNFEDEDGLLPVHLVGLSLKGRVDLESAPIDWAFEVGNGRGETPDPPQIVVDMNKAKAVNLKVAVTPEAVHGLSMGVGAYFDDIPAGAGHGQIDELILSGFATYRSGGWELLAEYFNIDHDAEGSGNATSSGYYGQAGYRIDDWMPYLRYDVVDLDDNDVYYLSTDDTDTISGGVRWDWQAWSAIKLQYDVIDRSPASGGSVDSSRLQLQVSFAF